MSPSSEASSVPRGGAASEGLGGEMYKWATDLWPLNRSITGEGVRETLRYLRRIIPGLKTEEVPSGTPVFDWTIPDEWNVRDAYIADESGRRVVDFRENNLHLLGYSEPVDVWLERDELDEHLYSMPELPEAIPYITSYYKRRWGFCVSERQRQALPQGKYHAVVDSTLQPGALSYGELVLRGKETREILISTYVCHPSMANNELSGIVVATALARWLQQAPRRFTYRIVFVPETIGSIAYLSRHVDEMKRNTIAGFVVTCVGDNRSYSFLPSRMGGTLADRVAEHVLKTKVKNFTRHSFLERGSDERQYCSPRIDLPVVSVMRSKYATYPEYHTSLDDLSLISPEGLEGGFAVIRDCIAALEANFTYQVTVNGEPQLGKRGLYSTTSNQDPDAQSNLLAYADGKSDLLQIAETIGVDVLECARIAERLEKHGLLVKADPAER